MYSFEDLPFVEEGKTKVLRTYSPHLVDILEKNDMTAGNGKRHELVPGKGKVCAAVSATMFRLAARAHVQHAFVREVMPGINRMHRVRMLPYEVVCRRIASGSYCKRHTNIADGTVLSEPVVELYLKSKARVFGDIPLPDDDPLVVLRGTDGISVVHPALVDGSDEQVVSLVHIPANVIFGNGLMHDFSGLVERTLRINHALTQGWGSVGCTLIDFKVEFGVTDDGIIVLADSLSPDEMRVRSPEDRLICKEPFRKEAPVDEMVELYTEALILSSKIA